MILLRQDSKIDKQKLESLLHKYGKLTYNFSTQLISDDIDKMTELENNAHTAHRLENTKRTKGYLEGLYKKASNGEFKAEWVLSGNKISALPVEIRKIKMYDIRATDYIIKKNEAIMYLDYTELLNIIAFEISYKDFGVNEEDIEDKLKDIGIITQYKSEVLKSVLTECGTFDKMLNMRVEDTIYMSSDKKSLYTYYMDKVLSDKTYRKVAEETAYTTMSIITQNLLSRASSLGLGIKLGGVFEDSIVIILPDGRNARIESELNISVIVRAFGRKFVVEPKIQVY